MEKLLEVTGMFITLMVVIVSCTYTHTYGKTVHSKRVVYPMSVITQ